MARTRKIHKPIKRKEKKTKKHSIDSVKIDLRQILMTDHIMNGADVLKQGPIDRTPYKKERGHPGFPLGRLKNISYAKLKNLKPISLAHKKHNGVPIGAKVNGKLVPLYEIQDGRHRVAKALAEGKTTIDAKIV